MRLKKFHSMMDGLHWVYEHNGYELSIVCHSGSYGWEKGLFEIMPPWKIRGSEDSVKGFLSFGDVQRALNRLSKMECEKE